MGQGISRNECGRDLGLKLYHNVPKLYKITSLSGPLEHNASFHFDFSSIIIGNNKKSFRLLIYRMNFTFFPYPFSNKSAYPNYNSNHFSSF